MKRASVAALVFALVGAVWLNQSVGRHDWEALRDRVFAAPTEHVVDYVRYPFVFLYRRAHDEEIYFATASAIVGRPFPAELAERGDVPDEFARFPEADGKWHAPYREVPFEYPPGVLPFIVVPRLVASSYTAYARVFGALMAACLFAACAIAIRAASVDDRARASKWWMATFLLLAHGAIAIQRLDAIVALFLALALDAAVKRRTVAVGVWIGLAAATKVTPALLVPIVIAADWARYRAEPRRAMAFAGAAGATCAIALAPMALASGGATSMLAYHAKRGLHVESVLGSLYGAARALVGSPTKATLDFGSFNLHGEVADALARAATPLTLVLVAIVAWRVARASATEDRTKRIACALVAGAAAIWIGSKVLSPQYLTWAIPLVLAVPGRDGARVYAALFLAVLLGQVYFRGFFDHVYEQRALGIVTVLARQAALVALLVFALRGARASDPLDARP